MSSSSWIGKSIGGRYQIEALLGQGGMSAVYKASDPNLNRTVAVKLIHPHLSEQSEFVDRFRAEASVVAQLRQPNIVQVFDFNQDGDVFYMVMEFVAGETLRQALDRLNKAGRQMPLVEVMKYALNLGEAIEYAHQRNVIHRDIKPANVILDKQGQAVLMDFGIAKIMGGPEYTATGATMGTALYMPPEQIRGERVDARSDIYAMGVMLFEMIAGRPPYQAASPMTILMMHLGDPLPDLNLLRPDCPAVLRAIVEKAMAKDPAQRYQSSAEMNTALAGALSALKRSLQAPTAVGVAAVAPTAPSPAGQPPAPGQTSAGGDATRIRQPVGPVSSPAAPSGDYQPPLVVTSGQGNKKTLIVLVALIMGVFAVVAISLVALFVLTRGGDEASTALAGEQLTGTALALLPATVSETPVIEVVPSAAPDQAPTQEPAGAPPAEPTTTLEPESTPAPERVGLLLFSNNELANAGTFSLTIPGVPLPAAGSHYTLWFSDGLVDVAMAEIAPGSDISITVESDENLPAIFDRAFITLEPDGQSDGPAGEPVFLAFRPLASLDVIPLLLATAPDTPGEKGYLPGAEEQAQLAADHGGFMSDSLAAGNLAVAQNHAEHVINILAGQDNSAFGDLNGDGQAQNPGDGFGVILYLERAREQAQLAAATEGAGEQIQRNSEATIVAIDSALAFIDEAIQVAGRVLASDSVSEAQLSDQALNSALAAILDGRDADEDGLISSSPGEGGIRTAYQQALKFAAFEFFNAGDVSFELE